MAIVVPKVSPGDLITADYVNLIRTTLVDLDARVAALEASGPVATGVRIDGFTAAQPVRVGDQIEVDGAGFLVPAILNTVTIGNVPVTSFAMMSGATKLVFTVPAIPNLPGAGLAMTVKVTNANGSDTSPQIVIFPKVDVPTGQTQVLYTNAPVMPLNQPNITAGQVYNFVFSITAFTDRAVSYTVAPNITGAGWVAQMVETNPLQIAANATQAIHIKVTAAAGVGTLSLAVTETTSGTKVTPGSVQLTIATGSPPPTPENRVRVTLNQAGGGATVVGNVLQFARNQSGGVQFTLQFTEAGDYVVDPVMRTPLGWTRNSLDIQNIKITAPAQGQIASQNVNAFFTAAAAAGNTDLMFSVTRAPNLSVTYVQPVTVV